MLKVVINFVYFQAFARLSAVYGGTYMLAKPECKVCDILCTLLFSFFSHSVLC
jgi:hypothetical protein